SRARPTRGRRFEMTPPRLFRSIWIALPVAAASLALAGLGWAQTPTTDLYSLDTGSDFAWGCFEPCLCPVLVRQPVIGTFELTKVASDPLFDNYVVTNVQWKLPSSTTPVNVVGSGKFRRGGEVAIEEQLTLDLSIDGKEPQHFDSGLVPE